MRIALVPMGQTPNSAYRSILPLAELANRRHEVEEVDLGNRPRARALARWCDVLHVYRWSEEETVQLARAAKASGAAVVWDDDDDSLRPQAGVTGGRLLRGRQAAIRIAARKRLFVLADLVTTTNPRLAAVFRRDGARNVQVIENYAIDGLLGPRVKRDGVHIGWAALREHELDLKHIPLVDALEEVLDVHADVHVSTIGIRLRLRHERYHPLDRMPMHDMMRQLTTFDIGIAPLSPEVRINHLRSNVKVKEYAALGVPWLASPIGPYEGMGEKEGGRLVPDDRWFEALDELVRDQRARRKLAKKAESWGFSQRLSRNVERWERAFQDAVAHARRRQAA